MAASSKNLHDILQRYGDGVGLENVWSSYMLVLMCHEFINKGQTDKGARKPQVSQKQSDNKNTRINGNFKDDSVS